MKLTKKEAMRITADRTVQSDVGITGIGIRKRYVRVFECDRPYNGHHDFEGAVRNRRFVDVANLIFNGHRVVDIQKVPRVESDFQFILVKEFKKPNPMWVLSNVTMSLVRLLQQSFSDAKFRFADITIEVDRD